MKTDHAFLRKHGWSKAQRSRPMPPAWSHPRLGHPWPTRDALALTHEAVAGDERAMALLGLESPQAAKLEPLGFVEVPR